MTKLTFLHLFTDLFRKEILPHSSEYLQGHYNPTILCAQSSEVEHSAIAYSKTQFT